MKPNFHLPIFTLTLITMPTTLWAQPQSGDYYGPHMMWGSWMFFGPLMMIAFIALIVVVVVLLVRWLGAHKPSDNISSENNAENILKERFARGEIDKQEYEERLRLLRD